MTVKLFKNQLVLEVPEDTKWITFKRMPETVNFCLPFSTNERMYILTDSTSIYFSWSIKYAKWYTDTMHDHSFNATDQLLQLIQQSQTYECW